ncbi:MAG: GNAT family N-acetyltransferase [Candidatus Kariarchaeaceae archaeon]|jgi:diamine N-acetyltransferase
MAIVIDLVEITKDNWKEVIKLDVQYEQQKYVASNVHSIAEAQFYKGSIFKALQVDQKFVGFTLLYNPPNEPELGHIVRYMIDKNHQGKGYGTAGLEAIIEQFKSVYNKKVITLTVIPENKLSRHLYEKVGFENTGEIVEGEIKYRMEI